MACTIQKGGAAPPHASFYGLLYQRLVNNLKRTQQKKAKGLKETLCCHTKHNATSTKHSLNLPHYNYLPADSEAYFCRKRSPLRKRYPPAHTFYAKVFRPERGCSIRSLLCGIGLRQRGLHIFGEFKIFHGLKAEP